MSIDMHCHHFTFKKGGYIHPKFINSRRIRIYLAGIGLISWRAAMRGDIPEPEAIDDLYRERLVAQTEASPLDHVVALAFDGIYDAGGRLDKDRTIKYVSNEAVIDLMRDSQKFLLGASVNPTRRDWRDELDKCIEAGAVLIKWLPSVMNFDPSEKKFDGYYDRLRETGTPLLMHVGFEFALPTANKHFATIDRLQTVLRQGVTVIAAHCCGGWPIPFVDVAWLWESPKMKQLISQYPNLYFDIAGMVAPHRKARLLRALRDPQMSKRIVYATDYPITLQTWAFRKETRGIALPENYYAKDVAIKERCGLTEEMLDRGYAAIGARRLSAAGVHRHLSHVHSGCCC
jgi:predicted TIM-barrel fold metal-dependent hydrolase